MTLPIVEHLALAGVGVGVVCTLALVLRCLARRDAVLRYRIMVGMLLAACAMIPIQALAAAFGPRSDSRSVLRLDAAFLSTPARSPSEASVTVDPIQPAPSAAPLAVPSASEDAALPEPALPEPGRPISIATAAPVLLATYLAGVGVVLSIIARRSLAVRRLMHEARPVTDERLRRSLARLVEGSGPAPMLLESGLLNAPACCDLGRPTIVLPLGAGALDDATLVAIFKHELVHLRRQDGTIARLAAALTAFLWFQPLVWVFAHMLRADREHSCDALVVRETRQPRSYALALLRFCGPESSTHRSTSLVGFESARSMRRRITMLADATHPAARPRHAIALGVGLACLASASVAHALLTVMVEPGPALVREPVVEPVGSAAQAANEPATRRMTAEVAARADGRSDEQVHQRLVKQGAIDPRDDSQAYRYFEYLNEPKEPAAGVRFPSATITDQATVLAVEKATADGNTLRASGVRLSLPDGSKLRAVVEGRTVSVEPAVDGVTRILITGGTVRILDERGIARIEARADSDRADTTLMLTSTIQEGAISFELAATDGTKPVAVRMDVRTGVPALTPESVHGSVDWKLILPEPASGTGELKMQWTYEISKLQSSVGC